MRKQILEFIQIVAETLPLPEPIMEFGSFQVEGQEGFADLRPFFRGQYYIGTDMRVGLGVDCVLDLHALGLGEGTVGTALNLETLEHVEFVRRAMEETHRALQPGGFAVISSMMKFPIHAYPSDYWRFTPEGFRSLLREFDWSFVDGIGEVDLPHTVVGVGCKGTPEPAALERFQARMADWHRYWNHPLRADPFGLAWRLFLPPILRIWFRHYRPPKW